MTSQNILGGFFYASKNSDKKKLLISEELGWETGLEPATF